MIAELIKGALNHVLSYKVDMQRPHYVVLDMHGTTDNNAQLVKDIAKLRSDYNIKIIVCPDKKSPDTWAKLKDMQVSKHINAVYSPGALFEEPDEFTSEFSKNHYMFWDNMTLDKKRLLPKDIFLIDNQKSMCNALTHAGGMAFYFDNRNQIGYTETKQRSENNVKAVKALTRWLEDRSTP